MLEQSGKLHIYMSLVRWVFHALGLLVCILWALCATALCSAVFLTSLQFLPCVYPSLCRLLHHLTTGPVPPAPPCKGLMPMPRSPTGAQPLFPSHPVLSSWSSVFPVLVLPGKVNASVLEMLPAALSCLLDLQKTLKLFDVDMCGWMEELKPLISWFLLFLIFQNLITDI